MEVSASGLAAQRRRLNAIAENLANASTTRTAEGGPYRRQVARFSEAAPASAASFQNALQQQEESLELLRTRAGHLEPEAGEAGDGRLSGVRADIARDDSPPILVHDPGHPDADENGYVRMPNINVVTEMVDMISATRAYEANVTAVKSFKEMTKKALEM